MSEEKKTALVTGANGQDGYYMRKYLARLGYRVFAHSWGMGNRLFACDNEGNFNDFDESHFSPLSLDDWRMIARFIESSAVDEIYHFGGQSSVSCSFTFPSSTISSHVDSTLGILEAIRACKESVIGVKFFFAASSEMYGTLAKDGANINTPFSPTSPYGAAKVAAFETVKAFRESYNMYAASAIMFNHESPRRKADFFTAKVSAGAVAASQNKDHRLHLGDLSSYRDFGWAPEYVVGMHEMMQLEKPTDIVIGTGSAACLEQMVRIAYEEVGLDWRNYVVIDPKLFRYNDLKWSFASTKLPRVLKWSPSIKAYDVMRELVRAKLFTTDSTTQSAS